MSSSSSSAQTVEEPTEYTLVSYGDNDKEEGRFKFTKNAEGKLIAISFCPTGGPADFMEEETIEDLKEWIQEYHPENISCRWEMLMEMYFEFCCAVFGRS